METGSRSKPVNATSNFCKTNKQGPIMRIAFCILLLVAAAGCSSSSGEAPEGVDLHAAGGKVLFKGQPVEGATVSFEPAAPGPTGPGRGAFSRTNAEGVFELRTFADAEGATPGEYLVSITKNAVEGTLSNEEMDRLTNSGQPVPPPVTRPLLPAKYGDAKQSGLKATITSDGENQFEFALTE
jgi:hypothetical protein